jgi:uncharacterized protein
MDYELLEVVFKRMNEFLIKHPDEKLEFLWHGGELCLLGADYFNKAREIQNKTCPETSDRIHHSIQSNLTLINQDIINAFKNMGINQVGTSYDMYSQIRGIGANRDTKKYNELFFTGLELLRENNMLGSVIYVVHKKALSAPIDIFYHLCNIFYDSSVQFNIIHIYGEDKHELKITDEEFAHFIGIIFQEWWKYKYTLPQMSSFRDYYYVLADKQFHASCVKTGTCAYRWLYIDPLGKAKHCCEGDFGHPGYGYIQKNTLEELYHHNFRNQILDRHYTLPQNECKGCRFWGVCHGGCAWNAKNYHNNFHTPNNCKATKVFLEQYFEPVTGLRFNLPPKNHSIYSA